MKDRFIHVEWEGPDSVAQAKKKKGAGVYQIYGGHPVYGTDVLLYIGKSESDFCDRIKDHDKTWLHWNQDYSRIEVYFGKIRGTSEDRSRDLSLEIKLVEELLIFAHRPAINSQGIQCITQEEAKFIHILNWGNHRDLLSEVSGARWSSRFDKVNYI